MVILTMLKKVCTKCNTEKSISDFYKNKNSKDGLSAWCKECQLAYHKIKDKQANVQEVGDISTIQSTTTKRVS